MLEDSKIILHPIQKLREDKISYVIGGIEGKGTMTCINVYPGIQIIYNDFLSFDCPSNTIRLNTILKSIIV